MRHTGRASARTSVSTLLGIVAAVLVGRAALVWGGGLLPLPRSATTARPVGEPIAVRATVGWSIVSVVGANSTPVMGGESVIGPNGALLLGPYGSVNVAGLTPAQAQAVAEKQLARFVKNPRVTLKVMKTGGAGVTEGWGPMTPSRVQPVTYTAPAPPVPLAPREVPAQPRTTPLPAAPLRAELGVPTLEMPPPAMEEPVVNDAPLPAVESPPSLPSFPMTVPPVENAFSVTKLSSATEAAPVQGDARPLPRNTPVPRGQAVASEWRPLDRPAAPPKPGLMRTTWDGSAPTQPTALPRVPGGMTTAEPPSENIAKTPRPLHPGGPVPVHDGGFEHGHAHPPVPRECAKLPLPVYVIEPPDILLVQSTKSLPNQPVQNQHLVRPDGKISLGIYGEVPIAGLTIQDAKVAVYNTLKERIEAPFKLEDVSVDVLAYNSKWYYVITDGGGYGEQVQRFPFTGNETVLDAISQIQGLPPVASRHHIWLARPACSPYASPERVLPVDYVSVTQCADHLTNYQVMPGDRIYVKAEAIITIDSTIAKVISPIERLFGVTLLGSTTVNSFRHGNGNGNNNNNNR